MREPMRVVVDRPADRLLVDRAELLTGWLEPGDAAADAHAADDAIISHPEGNTPIIARPAISAYAGVTNGLTDPSYKFALVADDTNSRIWAHELGHFLRRAHGESVVKGELMVSGGQGEKIPVQDAVQVFNRRHT